MCARQRVLAGVRAGTLLRLDCDIAALWFASASSSFPWRARQCSVQSSACRESASHAHPSQIGSHPNLSNHRHCMHVLSPSCRSDSRARSARFLPSQQRLFQEVASHQTIVNAADPANGSMSVDTGPLTQSRMRCASRLRLAAHNLSLRVAGQPYTVSFTDPPSTARTSSRRPASTIASRRPPGSSPRGRWRPRR